MIRLIRNAPMSDSDKAMLERLYHTYHRLMIYVANKIIPDPHLAEDAVSESFVKIIRYREKFRTMKCHQEKVYIVNIIKTTSINMKLKKDRHAHETDDLSDDMPDPNINILNDVTANEGYDSMVMAVLSLPDKLRDVAYCYFTHGMTHEEIAKELGISVSASKKRLERAKIKVRAKLGGDENA